MVSKQNSKHFLHRAAFGPLLSENHLDLNILSWIKGSEENKPLHVVEKPQISPELIKVSKENPKQVIVKSRDELIKLNVSWINQLGEPSATLREKMTLFWHDHFACRVRSAWLAQQQNNTLRQHALGNFRDLLFAVSKDPGMLQFLNNQQNKKDSPNENFAREVLELFTLGRGHYTEEDIKNSARAFTGWAFNPLSGVFVFREKTHDYGIKTFKGKTGRFSGEDILNIILEDKHTARFITEKIWRYFVSDEVMDNDVITTLADNFFQSGYQLDGLLGDLFSSSWFYDPRYVGGRIKSPVELLVGITSQTGGEFHDTQAPVFIQRALSQVLLFPPNVGGWPSGTGWIDSSSLMFRMSLPSVLLKNGETDMEAKDDGDVNNEPNAAGSKRLGLTVDWKRLASFFTRHNTEETLEEIEDYLLAKSTTTTNRNIIRAQTGKSLNDPEFIQKAFIGYMSLPEYQLC